MISPSVSKHGKDLHDIKINSFNGIFSTSLHSPAIHLQQCQHDIQCSNMTYNAATFSKTGTNFNFCHQEVIPWRPVVRRMCNIVAPKTNRRLWSHAVLGVSGIATGTRCCCIWSSWHRIYTQSRHPWARPAVSHRQWSKKKKAVGVHLWSGQKRCQKPCTMVGKLQIGLHSVKTGALIIAD